MVCPTMFCPRLRIPSLAATLTLTFSLGLGGCGEDLGSCDETAVIDDAAIAQGLSRCTSCHGSNVRGDARLGAPADLNFDTVGGRQDHAEAMWATIDDGTMPPPAPAGTGEFSGALKSQMRNWLACGAPDPVSGCGDSCGEWEGLWAELTSAGCLGCHADATKAAGGGALLGEAGAACDARTLLLGQSAVGPSCAAGGLTYVVPGDAAGSLLVQKLQAGPSCGTPMPPGPGLESTNPDLVARLRTWIDGGALAPECP